MNRANMSAALQEALHSAGEKIICINQYEYKIM